VRYVVRSDARRDILRQFEYCLIEQDAEPAARRFVAAVEASIAQVCRDPGIGAPKKLKNLKLAGLRSWPVKGFLEIRAYYLVSKSVVRVLHGKREIHAMLEDE